jgi:hypothetical protein
MHDTERYQYFLHGNATVLEGVLVEVHKLIVVVWVHKKVAVLGENIGGTYIHFGQEYVGRVAHFIDFLRIVVEVFSGFVPQV